MHTPNRHRRIVIALIAGAVLGLAACSSGTPATVDAGSAGTPAGLGSGLPDLAMTDVRTGQEVALAAFTPTDKPLLLWFWAPHCPTCRAEAPELEEFLAEHGDQVDIVGVGARDDFGYAEDFVDATGVSFPMLWDDAGAGWRAFEVPAQPAGVLVAADGTWVARWPGTIPLDDVLAEIGTAQTS